jgi:glycerol-3-phosphate O-acyltransferase
VEGDISDVTIVPVGISYDRMVEGGTPHAECNYHHTDELPIPESFVNEMLGESKKKETLQGFLWAASQIVRLHFGSIDVRIGFRDYTLGLVIFAPLTY